jgi:formamidopyrimidine-DNA glycosylase
MPELPEVETVRRGLEPLMTGHTFTDVETRRADLRFPFPERFAARLKGAKIKTLSRRAKYLVAGLSTHETLVMHLGMTGRFSIKRKGEAEAHQIGDYEYGQPGDAKHAHAVFRMSGGSVITYSDPRRFGYMLLIPEAELQQHPLFRALGVEPLGTELTPEYLARRAAGARRDLKAFLMDQRVIAGLGNIYVCEALYRARLRPSRSASTLANKRGGPTKETSALVEAIRSVLGDAIKAGGSTLRDYRQADGSSGGFQNTFFVYGREGEPCLRPRCRGIVERSVQAGRSTFYCPVCQR